MQRFCCAAAFQGQSSRWAWLCSRVCTAWLCHMTFSRFAHGEAVVAPSFSDLQQLGCLACQLDPPWQLGLTELACCEVEAGQAQDVSSCL